METVSLKISGMSCGHCVAAVDKALKSVDGVSAAKVEIGSAIVTLDTKVATTSAVVDAVEDAGYSASVV